MSEESPPVGTRVILPHFTRSIVARSLLALAFVWLRDGTSQSMGTAAQAADDWRFRREYLGRA